MGAMVVDVVDGVPRDDGWWQRAWLHAAGTCWYLLAWAPMTPVMLLLSLLMLCCLRGGWGRGGRLVRLQRAARSPRRRCPY